MIALMNSGNHPLMYKKDFYNEDGCDDMSLHLDDDCFSMSGPKAARSLLGSQILNECIIETGDGATTQGIRSSEAHSPQLPTNDIDTRKREGAKTMLESPRTNQASRVVAVTLPPHSRNTTSTGFVGEMKRKAFGDDDCPSTPGKKRAQVALGSSPQKSPSKDKKKKQKDKPKRPLSAYNLFFKDERQTILASIPPSPQCKDKTRKHPTRKGRPPPHGLISFQELAKLIGKRWKDLDPERKAHYQKLAKADMARYRKETADYERRLREKDDGSSHGSDSGSCASVPPHEVSEDVSFENAVTGQFETLVDGDDGRMDDVFSAQAVFGNDFEPCPVETIAAAAAATSTDRRSRNWRAEFLNPPPLPFMRPYRVPDFPPQEPNFQFRPSHTQQIIAQQQRLEAMENELNLQQSYSRRLIQDQFRTSNIPMPFAAAKQHQQQHHHQQHNPHQRQARSWGIAPMGDDTYPNVAGPYRSFGDEALSDAKGTSGNDNRDGSQLNNDISSNNPFEDNCWQNDFSSSPH